MATRNHERRTPRPRIGRRIIIGAAGLAATGAAALFGPSLLFPEEGGETFTRTTTYVGECEDGNSPNIEIDYQRGRVPNEGRLEEAGADGKIPVELYSRAIVRAICTNGEEPVSFDEATPQVSAGSENTFQLAITAEGKEAWSQRTWWGETLVGAERKNPSFGAPEIVGLGLNPTEWAGQVTVTGLPLDEGTVTASLG